MSLKDRLRLLQPPPGLLEQVPVGVKFLLEDQPPLVSKLANLPLALVCEPMSGQRCLELLVAQGFLA